VRNFAAHHRALGSPHGLGNLPLGSGDAAGNDHRMLALHFECLSVAQKKARYLGFVRTILGTAAAKLAVEFTTSFQDCNLLKAELDHRSSFFIGIDILDFSTQVAFDTAHTFFSARLVFVELLGTQWTPCRPSGCFCSHRSLSHESLSFLRIDRLDLEMRQSQGRFLRFGWLLHP
jgi:hypothetical protein